jgi:hypothetical protein
MTNAKAAKHSFTVLDRQAGRDDSVQGAGPVCLPDRYS